MSGITEVYLNAVMSNVAALLQLKQWSFNKQSFENIAQNYFGILIPAILNGRSCEKNVTFSVVLKLAPTDERYRVSGAVTIMFLKEIFVYKKLLHKYREFQNVYAITPYFVIPECYYVCSDYCKEVIVLQNMCVLGYKPCMGNMFLDLNHIILALKSLAKFHALSYILKEKNKDAFEEVKEYCKPLTENNNKRYIDILTDRLQKALKNFENTAYVPLLQILKGKCVELVESATNLAKSLCLCHGDMWMENVLFQYKDDTPISACIIDYQTTRLCSPAFDVLYLIVSSTSKFLREEHFGQLLDTYYQTLEQTLSQANLNPNAIYTKDMFLCDLTVVGPACLIVANTAIWLSNGLQQEGHVRSKIILNTEEDKKEAVSKYTMIIKNVIDDLTKYGYLKLVFD
ncbi:uncharacterized protein LOC126776254 [Nymphalis io]|uniref:uncharacterized protein LOC126776254 n=1 Tax=Inachis io TaxID=171585 RepID=UPI00216A9038|nr:uncharacterized protein LOC126776254 [Nymphalis io]